MRILHLAAVDAQGGAARAAFRLHQALLKRGANSAMLVKRKISNCESVHFLPEQQFEDNFLWNLIETCYLGANRSALSNSYFSVGYPGANLAQHPLVQQAQILHLHWLADFLSPVSLALLQALRKPIVWTLHDQRPFTGGCHFSAGCSRYQTNCASCPQLQDDALDIPAANLADQLELISARSIQVVTPSRWLGECARRSAFFRDSPLETISYAIETERFLPCPQVQARKELGLPQDAFQLLFGADFGNEKRKGLQELISTIKICSTNPAFSQSVNQGKLLLLAFGRPAPELDQLPIPVKSLGYIQSDEILRKVYSAANLFLMPSLEDNLPCTVLESMSCGTPVLAFNIGGVPDLVSTGLNGWMAPAGDTQAMAELLLSLVGQPAKCAQAGLAGRQLMETNYAPDKIADSYLRTYERLSEEARTARPSQEASHPAQGSSNPLWGSERLGPHLAALYPKLVLSAMNRFSTWPTTKSKRRKCLRFIKALHAVVIKPALATKPRWRRQAAHLKGALEDEGLARLPTEDWCARLRNYIRKWLF